jgi:hypothetical protein
MPRHRIGKIDTTTALLIGGGLLAVYFISKNKATTTATILPPGYTSTSPYSSAASTAQIQADAATTQKAITSGADVVKSIFSDIFG